MTRSVIFTLALVAACVLIHPSSAATAALTAEAVSSEPRFSSYAEAIRYVRDHYRGESIDTSRSSWITSAEYYPAHGRGYLILGMRGKPYIFAGVPAGVWKGFKGAPSLGKYYHRHIRGRYRFEL